MKRKLPGETSEKGRILLKPIAVKNEKRRLQGEASDDEDNWEDDSFDGLSGEVEIVILPPLKASQNYTVTSYLFWAKNELLAGQIQDYLDDGIEIIISQEIESMEISLPVLENEFLISSTSNSIALEDLAAEGNGSFCYMVYKGGETISKANILSGEYLGDEADAFGCEKIFGFSSLEIKELDSGTEYIVAYFLRSVDIRENAETSEVYFQYAVTMESSEEETENEEEFGDLRRLNWFALLAFVGLVWILI